MHFTEYDTRVAGYALVVNKQEHILLAWWNGEGIFEPRWTLPGGGVNFDESIEDAILREVTEETGLHVKLLAPLTTHSWTRVDGDPSGRPFKAVRVVYLAEVVGGILGTLETGGSTDFAEWLPLSEVLAEDLHTDIVGVAVAAWRNNHVK
jgi:8-oxo-dGTP diphosphatase